MKNTKRYLIIIMIISILLTAVGCSGSKSTGAGTNVSGTTAYPLTVTDDTGNKVTLEKEPDKIVSLAPSTTEILFALGAGSKVVGRSEYDNYPEEAKKVSVVGGFSGPNTELITKLAPQAVFAVKGSLTDDQKKLLESAGIKVIIFNPANIDGVYSNIKTAGQICNKQEKAKEITDSMEAKRQQIVSKLKDVKQKKVFIDLGSFYSAGKTSFIGSILTEINAVNIAGNAAGQWPQLTAEQVVGQDPEVYISLSTSLKDLQAVSGLSSTTAFKSGNVKVMEMGTLDNDIMQRPGPRIIDGLEVYAKTIYPDAFK